MKRIAIALLFLLSAPFGYAITVNLGDNFTFSVTSSDPDTGVLTDAAAVPAYRIYEDETDPPIMTGNMAKLDDDDTTGFYTELIAVTTGNGFERGKSYNVYITATVDGDLGGTTRTFTIPLDTDTNGRVRVVDGTGAGEFDTDSGTVLLRSATETQIDNIETDTAAVDTASELRAFLFEEDAVLKMSAGGVAEVDTVTVEAGDATDALEAGTTASLVTHNLDHLMLTAVSNRDTMPEVADDTVLANLMTLTDGDTSDFDHATMSLEALQAEHDVTQGHTDDIGAAGAGLSAVVWNAAWDAEVESEVDDALVVQELDHLVHVADADDPADNSIVAKLAASDGDWSGFTVANESLEALKAEHDVSQGYTDDIGVAGVGLTAVPWNASWDAEVESEVDDSIGAGTGTSLTAIPWNSSWDTEVESEVDDSLGAGTGTSLTAIPWNSNWDTEVESEVDDALVVQELDHLVHVADADDPADNSIIGKLASTDGDWSNFAIADDALQSIRDRGDAEWVTATGFSTHSAANVRTEMDSNSTDLNAILTDTEAQDTSTELRTLLTGADTAVSTVTTAQVNTEADNALITYNLDHLMLTGVANNADMTTEVADGTVLSNLLSKTSDTSTFVVGDESLEALRDQGDSAWITAAGFSTHTAANVRTEMDNNSTDLNAILTDTEAQDTSTEIRTLMTGADTAVSTVTTAQVNTEVDNGLITYNLDHLMLTGVANNADMTTEVADGTVLSNLLSATSDTSSYAVATDSQEGIRNQGDSAWITATGFSTHTAANVRTEMDSNSTDLNAILTDTEAQDTSTELRTLLTGADTAVSTVTTAQVNTEADNALITYNLDHLALTATVGADMTTEVADNTILSRMFSNGDTSLFVPSTDGLQLIRDKLTDIETDTAVIGALGAGLSGIPWNSAWDTEVESEVDDSIGAGTGTSLSAIPWNASWDSEVESEVDDSIGAGTGTSLSAVPYNSAWDADIQSEANDALIANNLDHLALTGVANNADMTVEVADGTILSNLMSKTSDTSTFTVADDSLEGISDSGGGDATEAKQDTIITYLDTEIADILTDTGAQDTSTEIRTLMTGSDTAVSTVTTAQVNTEVDNSMQTYNLDHLALTAVANNADMTTEIADGTVLSNIMSKTSDTSSFTVADDSLEGLSDGAAGGGATALQVWQWNPEGGDCNTETYVCHYFRLMRAMTAGRMSINRSTGVITVYDTDDSSILATFTVANTSTHTTRTP